MTRLCSDFLSGICEKFADIQNASGSLFSVAERDQQLPLGNYNEDVTGHA
jgi:hypothetical protein